MRSALWIAARELNGGVRGFLVLIACLALGVGAIAAAGSVAETVKAGLDRESRQLLGGDVEISVLQRTATPSERAAIMALGPTSRILDTNAMGTLGDVRELVDLKGVDEAYPLVGTLTFDGDAGRDDVLANDGRVFGAAAAENLFETFQAELGDRINIGEAVFELRAVLAYEPDQLGGRAGFWPRLMTSTEGLEAAGLSRQGALFRESFRVLLPEGADLAQWRESEGDAWEDTGFRVNDRETAADGLNDVLDMFQVFLAVVGLAALIAGGIGVAQATAAFLATRTTSIAALKAVGADAGVIRAAYLIQIAVLAGVGVVLGVLLGAATPYVTVAVAGAIIPLPMALSIYPAPLASAAVLGLLAALAFALPALGRAWATSPAALFRGPVEGRKARRAWPELIAAAVAGLVFAALAGVLSPRPVMTLVLLAGALAAFGLLLGVAHLVMFAARRLAPRSRGFMALALANLGGPGSVAPIAAPALGLGVALLTLVAVVQANLVRQISETAPASLPSMVFTQIPTGEGAAFDAILAETGVAVDDADRYRRAPRIIGRIIAVNGASIEREDVDPGERWIIDGSIGLTYAAAPPPEADITDGDWWPESYSGPPLISIEGDAARGLGAAVGDRIGFLILGREVEAEIANFRRIDWGGFGTAFAVIFAPGTLEAANPVDIAIARAPAEVEEGVARALADAFPDVNIIRLREALAAAADLFADLTLAVNAVASVAVLAGVFVLIGAFAAAARRRTPEAALLKTLGASRSEILGMFAGEFAAAGVLAAALGALLGSVAAYPIVVTAFEAEWSFPWPPVIWVLAAAGAAAAIGGALTGATALARPPARVLRAE